MALHTSAFLLLSFKDNKIRFRRKIAKRNYYLRHCYVSILPVNAATCKLYFVNAFIIFPLFLATSKVRIVCIDL